MDVTYKLLLLFSGLLYFLQWEQVLNWARSYFVNRHFCEIEQKLAKRNNSDFVFPTKNLLFFIFHNYMTKVQ